MSEGNCEDYEEVESSEDLNPSPTFDTNGDSKEEKLYTLKSFAQELIALFEKRRTDEEIKFEEFFGVKKEDVKILVQEVAPFERSQVIYSLNAYVNKNGKNVILENYSDDKVPPIYENIEIKKDEFAMVISTGYYFFEWKEKKFVLDLYFQGSTRFYRIWFKEEDEKLAMELHKELVNFFKECNFLKGEKLVFLPHGFLDFLDYPKLTWDDVILSEEIREEFDLNLIYPLENEKLCKQYGVPWRRGIMLGGKAGTGKTQVCRILCNILPKGVTMIWATPKALYDEGTIKMLFEAARFLSPSLIIIEDLDFIGLNRDFARNPILGELLTQLDGNDPNDGIFVISTTNRPELLDEALANRPSRFDIQLLFDLPNEEQRKRIIELFIKDMEFAEPLNMSEIVGATKDLTGSHIKEIFVHCQLKALKANRKITHKDVIDKALNYSKAVKKAQKMMVT